MPIFHDPHDSPPRRPTPGQVAYGGYARVGQSEYDLEEQKRQSWPSEAALVSVIPAKIDLETPNDTLAPTTLGRIELIDRLKRTKSPTWLQRHSDDRYFDRDTRPSSRDRPQTPLLNASEAQTSPTLTPEPVRDLAAAGLSIERPRSALHSGDFRAQKEGRAPGRGLSPSGLLATSPVVPWHRSFPAAANPAARNEATFAFNNAPNNEARAISRARAISQSSLNSFAFLPPTSPLVQQANNPDLDSASRPGSRQSSRSPERNNRRHTFSPASFQGYRSTEMARSASGTPAARHLRHGSSIPYQAHQPRRSSTYNQPQPQSNPATPFLGSRRPSFSSEASPLQHAPMVGSYEESILRGRMSTTPSRPLDFVAKIGVLGKGQCKANLKCPPHVTVPFPAVFYSYNTGNGRISDNEPSPYVGLIDLEHSLPQPTENTDASKRTRRHATSDLGHEDLDFRLQFGDEQSGQAAKQDVRRKEKRKRRATSPRAPPGGSYRIPAQGQLQIVLKNPNKTAVKLFLVPYDFSDMEAGQKTFIRQRSYSAGPIIDMPTSSRRNLGTDRPEAALSNSDDPNDRPILRYLIHLHICCPSKGRYYLYKSIRVVFANRVPDGKEKLRNEIQLPEPKYSVYKPTRDVIATQITSSLGAQLTAEKAYRRRSAGWPLSHSQQAYNPPLPPPAVQFCPLSTSASSSLDSPMPDLQPIPFSLSRLAAIESRPVSRDQMDIDPQSPFKTPMQSPKYPFGQTDSTFEKLNKGDVGYGGNAFSPVSSPTTPLSAGLLSQRLRGLDVQREVNSEEL
ncbi:hypothetical protein T440DRAFT_426488 [Plenodomus tracheiphilus IPT5]|uniref:Atos-like conserved domain-containing protein n=1 Tax=Plenodomus tracheiphilus IPT5 TaxID=1408161 RepID=A0A6A7B510_9PLEO|nr:hypothetical protein T440DRAFT_426488 [Plenodomus tracheiphilus IPT5]